jgi:VanZ family protein
VLPEARRVFSSTAGWRAAQWVYAIGLLVLLLAPHPKQTVEHHAAWLPLELLEGWAHVILFVPMGLLTLPAAWPASPARQGACLATYAAGSELIQFASPTRTPQLMDAVQDLIGLLVGVMIAFLVRRAMGIWRGRRFVGR